MRFDKDNSEPCAHEFAAGLCARCLCPETLDDVQRSVNALDNAAALVNHYSDVLGRYISREDAIFEAWRSNRRDSATAKGE